MKVNQQKVELQKQVDKIKEQESHADGSDKARLSDKIAQLKAQIASQNESLEIDTKDDSKVSNQVRQNIKAELVKALETLLGIKAPDSMTLDAKYAYLMDELKNRDIIEQANLIKELANKAPQIQGPQQEIEKQINQINKQVLNQAKLELQDKEASGDYESLAQIYDAVDGINSPDGRSAKQYILGIKKSPEAKQ